jgi:hypothetical protein
MKLNTKNLICQCGLSFALFDFIRSRKKGYCSYSCRKKAILEKKKLRAA